MNSNIQHSKRSRSPERSGGLRFSFLAALAISSVIHCTAASEKEDVAAGLGLVDALVEYHRTTGTHLDGPRCPMYPSCSAYAHKAIRKHGWYGFLISLERLFFREGGDLSERFPLAGRHLSETPRYLDPLEASTGQRPRLADPEELKSSSGPY